MIIYFSIITLALLILFGLSVTAKLSRIETGLNALHTRLDAKQKEKQNA